MFNVTIDMGPVTLLAEGLSRITPEQIENVLVGAVNASVDSAYELSRKTMLGGINLTDDYVQQHMSVEHATPGTPTATITAFGGKGQTTSLSHYGAMQEVKAVNWTTQRILAAGHTLADKWPGWVARKGDDQRGIAAGKKTAGQSVEVTRGGRKPVEHGFTMPGKRDREGNLLVFTRDKNGKIKSRTGPSVYQLFRVAGARIEDQVADDLQSAIVEAAENQFLKELP